MKKIKQQKGITLVVLVVTIIILLILAGITIMGLMAENGLISRTKQSKQTQIRADMKEQLILATHELQGEKLGNATLDDITQDWINFNINRYECTITESTSLSGKIVTMKEGEVIGKFLIDKNLNIIELNDDKNNIEFIYDIQDKYGNKAKILITITDNRNGIKQIEYPDGSTLQCEGNKKVEIYYTIELQREYEFKITSKSGEEKRETILIEEQDTGDIYKINNKTLSFSKIVMVGEQEECTTIIQAFDNLYDSGYKENVAIVLKSGQYSFQDVQTGSSSNISTKYSNMDISIIADDPGNVFVNGGEFGLSENGTQYAMSLKFYRIVFKPSFYGDGFSLNNDTLTNEYYNCVFVPPTGGWNGNVSNSSINTYNCLFLGGAGTYYGNSLSGLAQNCASTTEAIDPANGTKTTCITNITVDDSYNITSSGWKNTGTGINPDGTQANIGVYGGEYAWDLFNIYLNNNKIIIDTTESYNKVNTIKYKFNNIEKNANINDKGAEIIFNENGLYNIIIELQNGKNIYKTFRVEGLDFNSTYTINNNSLTFKRIVYVGENEECKNIKDAFDCLYDNNYKNNIAIVLKSGQYSLQDVQTGSSYNINTKYNNMDISIIADNPGNVFVNGGEFGLSENGTQYAMSLKFYRIVFKPSFYGHGFNLNNDTLTNEYYNCVFVPPTGGWNGNVSNSSINTYNCLFLGGAGTYYGNSLSGLAQNCASTTEAIDPANGTKTTCITNISVDDNYNITSSGWKNTGTGTNPDGTQANIGVYGGEFSW